MVAFFAKQEHGKSKHGFSIKEHGMLKLGFSEKLEVLSRKLANNCLQLG